MNDDLISRSALKNDLLKRSFFPAIVANALESYPAVDAVEVVRCKDCKFWDYGDCYRLELSHPTDFCSYGERKEDANKI